MQRLLTVLLAAAAVPFSHGEELPAAETHLNVSSGVVAGASSPAAAPARRRLAQAPPQPPAAVMGTPPYDFRVSGSTIGNAGTDSGVTFSSSGVTFANGMMQFTSAATSTFCASSISITSADFSVAFWMYLTNVDTSGQWPHSYGLVAGGTCASTNYAVGTFDNMVYSTTSAGLAYGSGNNFYPYSGNVYPSGQWVHHAVTWPDCSASAATKAQVYVNGVNVASLGPSSPTGVQYWPATGAFYIGNWPRSSAASLVGCAAR